MIYAIGDIHGQYTMLRAMLDRLESLPLQPEDTLVFLGDYIDRGEDSCAVVEALLALRIQHPNTVFLRGNHEQLLLDVSEGSHVEPGPNPEFFVLSNQLSNWMQNGGGDTLLSYGVENWTTWKEAIPDSHWEFYRETLLEYVTEHYHFVHAGLLPPGEMWEDAIYEIDPRLWIREPFLSSRASFDGRRVIFGHTPQLSGRPLVRRNKIGLDTGAVFGGPLTAAIFDTNLKSRKLPAPRFIQVKYARADL